MPSETKPISLRGYQELQLEFLKKNNGLVKGLQSPTGTGKSIVLLTYIKELIDANKYKTIVLTTGFNELVFQMANDAKSLGLTPKVIIGSGHLVPNCVPQTQGNAPNFFFSKTPVNICSKCLSDSKRRKDNQSICSKKCISNFLSSKKPKFIITNHSYFLVMKNMIDADLVVVDEAQTFGDFYMSFNTVILSEDDKKILLDYCNSAITPTSQVLKLAFTKGLGINENLLKTVSDELKSYANISQFELSALIKKLETIFSKKSFDNYLEENNGEYIKTNFFNRFDMKSENKSPDVIITSATLDSYTLKMFDCTNKNQIYIQREDRNRYKGSYFITDYSDYRVGFPESYKKLIVNDEMGFGYNKGLILCTSNESVRWTIEYIKEHFPEIAVHTQVSSFKADDGNKVLIGSKKFFQGINIPELDYVIMDKLPFSPYDDKFKAYSYYIEKTMREDAWRGYSLPLMFNSLLQGMGRLWRKNDIENGIYDQGLFMIFDSRLNKKFNYIEKRIVELKPGIKLIKMISGEEYKDPEEEKSNDAKPKNAKRKLPDKEFTEEEIAELEIESIMMSEAETTKYQD